MTRDPHGRGAIRREGPAAHRARLAAVLLHGRGATADDILALGRALDLPDVVWWAPEAAGHSWWPVSFLAPLGALEPALSSALQAVDRAVAAANAEGFADQRIALVGFSQGGCLALEYTARRGRPLRGVVGLSAGLVGTAETSDPPQGDLYGHVPKAFDYPNTTLPNTSVYISCHERDPHIPLRRVRESEAVFKALGAPCNVAIAPGAGHGVGGEDMAVLAGMLGQ